MQGAVMKVFLRCRATTAALNVAQVTCSLRVLLEVNVLGLVLQVCHVVNGCRPPD